MDFVQVSDIVELNGKTVRENNLSVQHNIPLDTLVEVQCVCGDMPMPLSECSCELRYARLYVVSHDRDCDGTPLYGLGKKGDCLPSEDDSSQSATIRRLTAKVFHGYSDDCLLVVSV